MCSLCRCLTVVAVVNILGSICEERLVEKVSVSTLEMKDFFATSSCFYHLLFIPHRSPPHLLRVGVCAGALIREETRAPPQTSQWGSKRTDQDPHCALKGPYAIHTRISRLSNRASPLLCHAVCISERSTGGCREKQERGDRNKSTPLIHSRAAY